MVLEAYILFASTFEKHDYQTVTQATFYDSCMRATKYTYVKLFYTVVFEMQYYMTLQRLVVLQWIYDGGTSRHE